VSNFPVLLAFLAGLAVGLIVGALALALRVVRKIEEAYQIGHRAGVVSERHAQTQERVAKERVLGDS
jgi:hypothetical protein